MKPTRQAFFVNFADEEEKALFKKAINKIHQDYSKELKVNISITNALKKAVLDYTSKH